MNFESPGTGVIGDYRLLTRVKSWLRYNASAIGVVVVLVVLWSVYARFLSPGGNNYFPSPLFTVTQTAAHFDSVLTSLRTTFTEVIAAFLLAILVGVVLGIVIEEVFVVRQMSMPIIIFVYSIPQAILAPLFIIWFGTGLGGIAAFGTWVAFFPIFINTLTGMADIDVEYRQLCQVIGASRWQTLRYVKLWKALPHIASSIRVAVQLSIVGVIIAEFLATGQGLGYLIVSSTQNAQIGLTFGTVIM
ncbi:MAG TPA: ABC transporter permease subunit, partial [Methanomicrobiales archaeon]|nr:ABC transporter permease subunit [Methanomicrobiales archaeon]